jgi:hypothetical protein
MRILLGILIVIAVVVIGAALLVGGMALGRSGWGMGGYGPAGMTLAPARSAGVGGYAQPNTMPFGGMMGYNYGQAYTGSVPYGGMMGGAGMMGGGYGPGMMGMMGGAGMMGMMGGAGMMGTGMMGSTGSNTLYGIQPLSLAEVREALDDYLAGLGDDDLRLGEVMVFDNHAYAQVVEKSTGIGAFEVLVDPVTLAIAPEPGPNMMWNLKYSPMASFGSFGMMGMMGGTGFQGQGGMMGGTPVPEVSAEMPVSPAEAVETAQRYLEVYLPGAQVEDEADAFYGYYTLDILRDGQTVGMLSVNGYTRQVFLHTWHGDFLDMAEGT